MSDARRAAILTALGSALVTAAAQYVGVTRPASDGLAVAERQLDKREAQITRREERIGDLEGALEECIGQPIARGPTRSLASKAAPE